MEDRKTKPTREELVAMLQTRGWDLVTGSPASPLKDRTLEDVLRTTHEKYKKGEEPGLISRMETVLELDLIQLQQLWEYLGLPM